MLTSALLTFVNFFLNPDLADEGTVRQTELSSMSMWIGTFPALLCGNSISSGNMGHIGDVIWQHYSISKNCSMHFLCNLCSVHCTYSGYVLYNIAWLLLLPGARTWAVSNCSEDPKINILYTLCSVIVGNVPQSHH